ncbi:MAG TPA: adaptor protein MecA, partial [Epulopiscium sp.]|nr:adaptor protein MecA [Candidatus Epulonipiscium sp.]
MRIEKINDTQIRVTLSHSDLNPRDIKISELAYGSKKAQELFREMMTQAYEEFGFETENVPLMI